MSAARSLVLAYRSLAPLAVALRLVLFVSDVPLVMAADAHERQPVQIAVQSDLSETDFLTLTNAARLNAGRAPLRLNDELTAAAYAKVRDMAAKGYWDHFRPSDQKAPWDFIEESGYDYRVAGENLARGFQTPAGITRAWLASPTHRANLLSDKYEEVGFATLRVIGTDGTSVLLTVQMFGSR